MDVIMCQLSIVTGILEYIDYCNYFFIANIDFLGGWLSRKSKLPWWSIETKENYSFLGGQGQPRKQLYLDGLDNFLGGCWQSRKLLSLVVVSPQENFFPRRLQYFLGPLAN
jgi:hypothetical protein